MAVSVTYAVLHAGINRWVDIVKPSQNAIDRTTLLGQLQGINVDDVVVVGFDANICVRATIFGNAHVGLLQSGFDVITSRSVLASGGDAALHQWFGI